MRLNRDKAIKLFSCSPAKSQLVIKLKTAKQLGLKIPPNVLATDRVIR
jgi:hypothetical protein